MTVNRANYNSQELRENYLDNARALSMIYIISFWHMLNYTSYSFPQPIGDYITSMFLGALFILSGYLLRQKYTINNFSSFGLFIKKRILRIFPLLIASILSIYFIYEVSLKQSLYTLLGISAFFLPNIKTLWFVSMIIFFYLLYPLISVKYKYKYVLIFILYLLLYSIHIKTYPIDIRFFYYLPCFIIGIFIAENNLHFFRKNSLVILTITLCCLCYILYKDQNNILGLLLMSIITLGGGLMVINFSRLVSNNSLLNKILFFVAYSSFAAYLFHRQIFAISKKIIPEYGNYYDFIIFFFISIIIFYISYHIQSLYDTLIHKICK